jgi:hypothetical protein
MALAYSLGYKKVSHSKLAVVKKNREWVAGGGFMFAMCSATETYDIALVAEGIDICHEIFDGDPIDSNAQSKLDFNKTFAFKNFILADGPSGHNFSTIDVGRGWSRNVSSLHDYFTLFDFSAKWDPVSSILTQCHTRTVKGFIGQTTAFRKQYLKTNVLILGENKAQKEARYIHGIFGKGFWTFYGGARSRRLSAQSRRPGHRPESASRFSRVPLDFEQHPFPRSQEKRTENLRKPPAYSQTYRSSYSTLYFFKKARYSI